MFDLSSAILISFFLIKPWHYNIELGSVEKVRVSDDLVLESKYLSLLYFDHHHFVINNVVVWWFIVV